MNLKAMFLTGSVSVLFLAFGSNTSATPITFSASFSTSSAIPDNDPTGVADTRIVSIPGATAITGLQVNLNIAGGFNGDYYAYLRHGDTGFAVLLNRVGLSSAHPFGYADSGLDITLQDAAPNGDVHLYQALINPNGGTLTGQWQPDGRNVEPSVVSDSTLRAGMLRSFNGLDPNGAWTLFVSDNSALGIGTLTGWGLTVIADSNLGVPETGSTLGLLLLGCSALLSSAAARQTKRSTA